MCCACLPCCVLAPLFPQLLVVLPLTGVSSAGPEGWGLREDTWDSLLMVASRPQLLLLLLAYTGSLQGYNICGMATTGEFPQQLICRCLEPFSL